MFTQKAQEYNANNYKPSATVGSGVAGAGLGYGASLLAATPWGWSVAIGGGLFGSIAGAAPNSWYGGKMWIIKSFDD